MQHNKDKPSVIGRPQHPQGKCSGVTVSMPAEVLARLDGARGDRTRSAVLLEALDEWLLLNSAETSPQQQ